MKLLLVLDSHEIRGRIENYVKSLGIEVVCYQHILKAMDNVDEISPDGIVVSASDFPRHWKTLVSFVHSERPPETCAIVLLHGSFFSEQERKKALSLDVSCLINETRLDKGALNQLREVFRPYISAEKWVNHLAVRPENSLAMIVTNPLTGALIPGKAVQISPDGAVFMPDKPALTKNLPVATELPGCSIRAGGAILSPVCRVVRNGYGVITLEFTALSPREKNILDMIF
ncbi:MAG: PilZ domain-containing protein [Spirochaetaceae bacterium]|jgi:hypothetical protein|nr:PilZ domain-containing protein [Spirochaetaceae bacterium]